MAWFAKLKGLFGQGPIHEAAGRGRRSLAWLPANPGAVAALAATHTDLRTKSRDLVRRNAWAQAGIEDFVANAPWAPGSSPNAFYGRAFQGIRPGPVAGLVRRSRCGGTHGFLWPAGPGLPGHARRG